SSSIPLSKSCLVAHNGKTWDYKILQRTFKEVCKSGLGIEISSCDSLPCFKLLDKDQNFINQVPEFFKKNLDDSKTQSETNRISYSLSEVNKRIFGNVPSISHNGLEDCKTLANCCLFYGSAFINYI
ncbi:MAG: MutSalpha complex binding, partial [Paramarteilia canceri]